MADLLLLEETRADILAEPDELLSCLRLPRAVLLKICNLQLKLHNNKHSSRLRRSFTQLTVVRSVCWIWCGTKKVKELSLYVCFRQRDAPREGEAGDGAERTALHHRGPEETHRDQRPGAQQRPGQSGEAGGGGKTSAVSYWMRSWWLEGQMELRGKRLSQYIKHSPELPGEMK